MSTILAIDDRPDNLLSLSALLKSTIPGCNVITALSGHQGIEMAETKNPDTILLDVHMPEMDGFEACNILKTNPGTKHIPVILLTAVRTGLESRVKGLELGADAFLVKPVDQFELAGQVKAMLRIKKAEDALRKERDSLEQVVAERSRALRESEEKLHLIIDTSPVGICTVDPLGNFVTTNITYERMLGYSKEELRGLSFFDVTHLDNRPKNKELFQEMFSLETTNFSMEKRYICKDGTIIEVSVHATGIMDDEGNARFGTAFIEDITERKQAEEALKASEESFLTIFQNNPAAIAMTRLSDGRLTHVNQAWQDITGYSSSEAIGCKPIELNFWVSLKQRDRIVEMLQNHEKVRVEIQILNKFGEIRDLLFSAEIINIAGQDHMLSMAQDLTKFKEMEGRLQQSQKMESIGTLAGGIAHDFNNILSSVIGYTELALSGAEKGTELEDDLQEVLIAGLRAKDLVRQILTYARQSDEAVKPVPVNGIAKEVLKFLKSSIPATIQINDKINSDSLIMGSHTQVHQVLMNLCTNAAYAMEENGGILDVSVKDIPIDRMAIPDLKPGEYIQIKVSDTGMGISPQHIHTIFEPYFTTKPVGEGTGMGLAVAHGIVESYGGQIKVDSTIGKGTCFTIYLPITKKRKVHTHSEKEDLPLGNENILFVDDEAPIAKMGTKVLEQLGYSVTTSTSSVEALELFRSKPRAFDIVITDMTMPNMTGDKLAAEMMKIRSDIPVVVCTGNSKKISEESAAGIGIKALAYKPIVKADLAKTVRKVLDETNSSE